MKKKILLYIGSRANYSSQIFARSFTNNKKIEPIVVLGAAALIDKYGNLENLIIQDGFKVMKR